MTALTAAIAELAEVMFQPRFETSAFDVPRHHARREHATLSTSPTESL